MSIEPDDRTDNDERRHPEPDTASSQNGVIERFRGLYGGHPLHLLGVLASFALVCYVIAVMGLSTLWNTSVWWQSIVVWFLGAVVFHDLVLFPLYAVADRTHTAGLRILRGRREPRHPPVPATNYVRIPVLASGLLFLLFFPGIIEQGSGSYLRATGQTQAPLPAPVAARRSGHLRRQRHHLRRAPGHRLPPPPYP